MIERYRVPDEPALLNQGLREMEERDVPEVTSLYASYMTRFDLALELTQDEIRHHLIGGSNTAQEDRAVWTYVVEVRALMYSSNSTHLAAGSRHTCNHRLLLVLLVTLHRAVPRSPSTQNSGHRVSLLLCHKCWYSRRGCRRRQAGAAEGPLGAAHD